MAKNDNSILRYEENGIEYFTIVATGESGLSTSGLARSLGVSQSTITRLVQKIQKPLVRKEASKSPKSLNSNNEPLMRKEVLKSLNPLTSKDQPLMRKILKDSLEPLTGKCLTLTTRSSYQNITVYTSETWRAFAEYYAFDAKVTTKEARNVLRAIAQIGADSFIQGKTGWLPESKKSSRPARESINRILNTARPYEALYSKELCDKAVRWFGCQFYWNYLYCFMTPPERIKLETLNPSCNGRRNEYIHQWLPEEIRIQLNGRATLLLEMLQRANSKNDFVGMHQRIYGDGWQIDLFK